MIAYENRIKFHKARYEGIIQVSTLTDMTDNYCVLDTRLPQNRSDAHITALAVVSTTIIFNTQISSGITVNDLYLYS